MATGPSAPLGYYWGDDSYSVGHGPDALATRLAGDGPPLERMRLTGATTSADEIAERVATATLFGGGTLVVVAEPAPLIATKVLAARLVEALGTVATGNGLAFLDTVDGTARRPASLEPLRNAVAAAGGVVGTVSAAGFPVPSTAPGSSGCPFRSSVGLTADGVTMRDAMHAAGLPADLAAIVACRRDPAPFRRSAFCAPTSCTTTFVRN